MTLSLDPTWLASALLCLVLCVLRWVGCRSRSSGWPRWGSVASSEGVRQLGPYTLADRIGAGAMGEVYRAWHPQLGVWRAVKVLSRQASARERARFEQEARLGAELDHPNIVSIYERGSSPDGTSYYAMELLDGVTLEQLVEREGPQSPTRVVQILVALCAALAQAHGKGLVHRDIKPSNVLVSGVGLEQLKLIDFGLIEHVDAVATGPDGEAVVGTPLYISPEAIVAPETVSARSDVYGTGALAHFLLTGAPVFQGRSVIEVCSHHLHTPPAPLSAVLEGAFAQPLAALITDCLAKDPMERPASAAELGRRLACLDSEVALVADAGALALPGANASGLEALPCLALLRLQRQLDQLEAVLAATNPIGPRRLAA